jgi:hypothetical protein
VQVWDVSAQLREVAGLPASASTAASPLMRQAPLQVFTGHPDEGFAMDWSPVAPGKLVTGETAHSPHAAAQAALAMHGATLASSGRPSLHVNGMAQPRGGRGRPCVCLLAWLPTLLPACPRRCPWHGPVLTGVLLCVPCRRLPWRHLPVGAHQRGQVGGGCGALCGPHCQRGGPAVVAHRGHRVCQLLRGQEPPHLGHAPAAPARALADRARYRRERHLVEQPGHLHAGLGRG